MKILLKTLIIIFCCSNVSGQLTQQRLEDELEESLILYRTLIEIIGTSNERNGGLSLANRTIQSDALTKLFNTKSFVYNDISVSTNGERNNGGEQIPLVAYLGLLRTNFTIIKVNFDFSDIYYSTASPSQGVNSKKYEGNVIVKKRTNARFTNLDKRPFVEDVWLKFTFSFDRVNQVGNEINFNNIKIVEIDKTEAPQDSDGDGIIDDFDQCPSFKGSKCSSGCPDIDGDCIKDRDDECDEIPGIIECKGCKDTDGDGICDKLDRCPGVFGEAKYRGCKDTDGDEIPDNIDDCIGRKGPKCTNGCPDDDNDCVKNEVDLCPQLADPRQGSGCPDFDDDGVDETEDACPCQYGKLEYSGCPTFAYSKAQKKQQWLYKGGGSISTLVIGGIFQITSSNTYNNYLNASTYTEAEPFYQQANKQQLYALTAFGIGLSGLTYTIVNHRKRLKTSGSNIYANPTDCEKNNAVNLNIQPTPNGVGLVITF